MTHIIINSKDLGAASHHLQYARDYCIKANTTNNPEMEKTYCEFLIEDLQKAAAVLGFELVKQPEAFSR